LTPTWFTFLIFIPPQGLPYPKGIRSFRRVLFSLHPILITISGENAMSRKTMNRLTEVQVRRSKPGEKSRKISDGGGMYLLVHHNGSKYWRLNYRVGRRQQTAILGVWPAVGLKEAREKRDQLKALLKEGKDPKQIRDEEKKEKAELLRKKQVEEEGVFKRVTKEWIRRQSVRWTEKHCRDVRRTFENHIFPELGGRHLNEIDVRQVLGVLRALESEGKHEAAHRARQRIEAVFRYGIITGICEHNPAAALKGALTPQRKKPQAALAPEELPEFLRRLEVYEGHRLTQLAMRFMLLTFVRTTELRHAEWKEFRLEGKNPIWIIPPERMKMRREHQVPLARQALEVLDRVREFSAEEILVFPGQHNPQRPMSENTLLYALYRMGYHSRATTHGFRSTASTILNESGRWHPDAIERQLAHTDANQVRKVYNRAEYLDERRRMMQWWADHLDTLSVPAEIINLHERRREHDTTRL